MFNSTKVLHYFAKRRANYLKINPPYLLQVNELINLVKKARATDFGIDHAFNKLTNFSSNRSVNWCCDYVTEYQKHVPLRKYEDFWKSYWQTSYPLINNKTWPGTIPYFCVSSGTSLGSTKYIPCTKDILNSNSKAGTDLLFWHVLNTPNSKLLSGKSFFLGGSTDLVEVSKGIFQGDLSGIAAKNLPSYIKPFYYPPADLALISDWEEKIEILARNAAKTDIRLLGGVPSWLLIFLNKMASQLELKEPLISKLFPNLEVLVHGGVNFNPYKTQFSEILKGSNSKTREVYPASEGFVAVADRSPNEGLRLNLDHGIFFEFIPVEEIDYPNPTRHWIYNVETGVNYALALTTSAGLWSYLIGDTIKFTSLPDVNTSRFDAARIMITGRLSYMLSAFGEHLIGSEIEESVAEAANEFNLILNDFAVGAIYPKSSRELGRHVYIFEFDIDYVPESELLDNLLFKIDQLLQQRNEDYQAHRANGFGLNLPTCYAMSKGSFKEWMKLRGKLGGQNKVPRVINDQTLLDNLISFAQSRTANHQSI